MSGREAVFALAVLAGAGYAGNYLLERVQDATAADVAAAQTQLDGVQADYLSLAPPDSCESGVLRTAMFSDRIIDFEYHGLSSEDVLGALDDCNETDHTALRDSAMAGLKQIRRAKTHLSDVKDEAYINTGERLSAVAFGVSAVGLTTVVTRLSVGGARYLARRRSSARFR